jgi:hypothetical protein
MLTLTIIASFISNSFIQILLNIVFYFYFSYCIYLLAKKNNVPGGIWAFIPIANIFVLIGVAKKFYWWILLFLVPLVNIGAYVLLWMAIAKTRNQPQWLGILSILPIGDVVLPGYLAFTDVATPVQPGQPQKPS